MKAFLVISICRMALRCAAPLAVGLMLAAFAPTPAAAQSAETLGVMGMVNRAMRDAGAAGNPNTSATELERIRSRYAAQAAQWEGHVREQETRTKLAQRYQQERARIQREEAIRNADEVLRQAKALRAQIEWLLKNSR